MLFYVVIAIIILSTAVAFYYFQTPVYKLTDKMLGIPEVMGFDHQNCQLDTTEGGSCWVKYINSPDLVPRIPLRPPFKGWNSVHLSSDFKTVDMPSNFFQRSWGYYGSPNYPI